MNEVNNLIAIRYVKREDRHFWFRFDRHLSDQEFENKVHTQRGYVLFAENRPVGLMRYNLFWDQIPFCTLLYIDPKEQHKGYGKKLMEHWQDDMKEKGYGLLLVSTQVDEQAQHFYRKIGYQDCGGLIMNVPGFEQPMELFMCKAIEK